jgi:hypothetical protein
MHPALTGEVLEDGHKTPSQSMVGLNPVVVMKPSLIIGLPKEIGCAPRAVNEGISDETILRLKAGTVTFTVSTSERGVGGIVRFIFLLPSVAIIPPA